MKKFSILIWIFICCFSVSGQILPGEAQIKKDLMNPGVLQIIFRGKGSLEKFVENGAVVNEFYRSVTVRRKTEKPGVTVDVIGDVVYRLVGGRWIYRKMRYSGNEYSGIKKPTVAELNKLVEMLKPNDLDNMYMNIIGEIETIKIYSFPNWEWHTPNSVSFNVVMVHWIIHNGGSYTEKEQTQMATHPNVFVDKVERIQRWRIYRDSEGQPWKSMIWTKAGRIGDTIRNEKEEFIKMMKFLERKQFTREQVEKMPRPTKVPFIIE